MKSKLCSLTLFAAITVSFFANFERFFWGGTAEVWNFLLSVGYLAAWGWFLYEKRRWKALCFYRIWWTISLIGVVVWIGPKFLFFPEIFVFVAWPLGAFFLSQLFGLNFLLCVSLAVLYPVFSVICAVMLWLGIRKMKT